MSSVEKQCSLTAQPQAEGGGGRQKSKSLSVLLISCLLGAASLSLAAPEQDDRRSRQLLRDTDFANGFGIGGFAGVDMRPLRPSPIPDDDKPKYWTFGEGAHRNFTDEAGHHVKTLYEHLLIANRVIDVNRSDCLTFSQYNNYGLSADDPARNTRLVKRVQTDRKGDIRLYYNTKNEIRNVATAYGAKFLNDLWPHLILWQHLEEPVKMAAYRRIDCDFTVTVLKQSVLSDWLPSREMNVKINFWLVDERRPKPRSLWVGLMLHSTNPRLYREHIGREQHGDVTYRDTITRYGPPLTIGESRKVSVELRKLILQAICRFDDVKANLSRDPDAYSLRDINCGFEGLGHWETEIRLAGLSLRGYRLGTGRAK